MSKNVIEKLGRLERQQIRIKRNDEINKRHGVSLKDGVAYEVPGNSIICDAMVLLGVVVTVKREDGYIVMYDNNSIIGSIRVEMIQEMYIQNGINALCISMKGLK